MFNIKGKDSDKYFKEVEDKLLEETNYINELEQGQFISDSCNKIPNILFPSYYPDFSSDKIITMDWMHGIHIGEFTKINTDQKLANQIGQALWDFYMFQIHHLKKVHADPHPGNFLISKNNELIALDFGCMKVIPDSFYVPYFELTDPNNLSNRAYFIDKLYELEILTPQDTDKELVYFEQMFHELLSLFTQPFQAEQFDFSNPEFFSRITDLGEKYAKSNELRKMNGNRGSKHFIYMNRTFFGLYNLLFDLKSNDIQTKNYLKYI
jgi:predicted unusual protein kinase regulating ubiquinone biosynthesis (AarF/ABC1/UbiB family)